MTAGNQLSMDIGERKPQRTVPIEIIRIQPSAGAAFELAYRSAGLDDKEVYGPLKIDAATFSKIKSNQATLQADKIRPFCDLVDNTIYLEWLAFQLGCTLVLIKSEAERRAEVAETALAKEREKVEMLRDLLRRSA